MSVQAADYELEAKEEKKRRKSGWKIARNKSFRDTWGLNPPSVIQALKSVNIPLIL